MKLNFRGTFPLFLLIVFNAGAIFFLTGESFSVWSYRGREAGTFSMAEAAYLGAQWSRITAGWAAVAAINIMIGLGVIIQRLRDLGHVLADTSKQQIDATRAIAGNGG
ncbi:hypothetical protein Ga0061061_111127 [Chelatococcus sambhunathii]|uniref:Uncharacterized protein n=1 Tax=Chelatococcus sambhunathii TaxID=363953 RepID=A0ABM9U9L4_9HYPH|nr:MULTISPECIES: hypothetical protein [Chelatococcus]CUA90225.1 hypothetical protein Ga0061061_111127 [Chelatococcus sambhunathii]